MVTTPPATSRADTSSTGFGKLNRSSIRCSGCRGGGAATLAPPYARRMSQATSDAPLSPVMEVATRARAAAAALAPLPRRAKDAALLAMADALVARTEEVLAANSE